MITPSTRSGLRGMAMLAMALLAGLAAAADSPRDPMRPAGVTEVFARRGVAMVLQIEPVAGTVAGAPRLDVRASDAPVSAFFEKLAEVSRTNLLVHPEATGRLNLTLKQVALTEVLQAVRDLYGLDYRTSGSGYLIMPASAQTRVFQLNYLDLHRIGVSHTRVSSGQVTQGMRSQHPARVRPAAAVAAARMMSAAPRWSPRTTRISGRASKPTSPRWSAVRRRTSWSTASPA